MLNYKGRVPCKGCGAEHCATNRVNWWDSCGNAYGPDTKKDWYVPLCDKCAAKKFERLEDLLSKVIVNYVDGADAVKDRDICKAYKDAEDETGRIHVNFNDLMNNHLICVARYEDEIIGFVVFSCRGTKVPCAPLMQLSDVYVKPEYRQASMGRMIVNYALDFAQTGFVGIELEHNMHESVCNLLIEGMELGEPIEVEGNLKAICMDKEVWMKCF